MERRKYQDRSPWITFSHEARLSQLWVLLGEAYSKCEHLTQSVLPPPFATKLAAIYLAKGALASVAIEGNTLTDDEAREAISGNRTAPPSREYLEQEVINVAKAIEAIDVDVRSGEPFRLTAEWLREQNRRVLEGLDNPDHVVPGEFTSSQLVVGPYRAAPPEDAPYLLDRLCEWLEAEWLTPSRLDTTPPSHRFALAFHAAVLGHLYVAWIHPFGDGNGRTARLLECAVLAHSGTVPWISANVLSDHYNRTRTRYYRLLQDASEKGQVAEFLEYSAQGFVDHLREQLAEVREWVRFTTWMHYVDEALEAENPGKLKDRHRRLALALADRSHGPVSKAEMRTLNPRLAVAYASLDDKTVTRDITALLRLGLARQVGSGRSAKYTSTIESLDAFQP